MRGSAGVSRPARRATGTAPRDESSLQKNSVKPRSQPPAVPPGHTRLTPPPAVRPYYAGFWKRFAAYFIDEIILNFIAIIVILAVAALVGVPMGLSGIDEDFIAPLVVFYFVIIVFLLNWLYHTVLESSSRQATLGKMAMGIVVTDMEGGRISFGRANGRFWSKILSGLFFSIGYIIAGFTERKQALHDLIAATLVVNG
jgi:uncharacterized RDD family membrane protein YckC